MDTAGHVPSRNAARGRVALGVAGPLVAAAVLPTPDRLLHDARAAAVPDEVIGAVTLLAASVVVWLLAAWALIVLGAAATSRVPGLPGRAAGILLGAIAPHATRRMVLLAAGASIVAATSACGAPTGGPAPIVTAAARPMAAAMPLPMDVAADGAADGAATRPHPGMRISGGALLDLDWPRLEGGRVGEHPARPARATQAPTSQRQRSQPDPQPTPHHHDASARPVSSEHRSGGEPRPASGDSGPAKSGPGVVTVRPGDSLWTIAAAHLPAGSTASEIDTAWRAWYSANRDAIGDNPDLILPGEHLTAPTAPTAASAPAHRVPRDTAATGTHTDRPASKGAHE